MVACSSVNVETGNSTSTDSIDEGVDPVATIKAPENNREDKEPASQDNIDARENIILDTSDKTGEKESTNDSTKEEQADISLEGIFTHTPLLIEDIAEIVTLGNLNPPSHVFPTDHIYFYGLRKDGADHPEIANLFAPGDLPIKEIRASEHVNAGFRDYSIYFQPGKEVTIYFGHVSSLSEEIFGNTSSLEGWTMQNEYSTGGEIYRQWRKECDISIPAGQILGTAGGNKGQWALDLGVYDSRLTQENVANAERWRQSQYLHAVDPLSLMIESLLEEMIPLVKRDMGKGERPPFGSILQDIPGTAQGCWFLSGINETYPEDNHLALVHSNIHPAMSVISAGSSISTLKSRTYEFIPEQTGLLNRDFSGITPDGNIYGFQTENHQQTIIMNMPDNDTLWLETLPRLTLNTDDWVFSGNKNVFNR
ncbi:hypothetical protein ACFLWU_06910 [Chloroflexota bacterium]